MRSSLRLIQIFYGAFYVVPRRCCFVWTRGQHLALLSWPPRYIPALWWSGKDTQSGMECLLHGMEVDFLKEKTGKKRLRGRKKVWQNSKESLYVWLQKNLISQRINLDLVVSNECWGFGGKENVEIGYRRKCN